MLVLRPWTVKQGKPFVERIHRRLPKVQGALWAVAVRVDDGDVVGCALVGHAARLTPTTLAVLRVAVIEGHRNACSMLYGACSRMARAAGADNLVTYTHTDEPGTSLRAAGWVYGGLTDGGEHGRKLRPRRLAVDASPKHRWFAPWSKRANA